MAITSIAGATLTKIAGATGSPRTPQFSTQSYCGWIYKPSSGIERLLFDHDGFLQIKISNTDKITLVIDGISFSGPTTLPDNKWIFWGCKRSSGNLHTVTIRILDCVTTPVLGILLTEINVTQAFNSGPPTQFTVHIPAGCSICGFQYGANGTNLTNSASSWNFGAGSTSVWHTVLRHPNDLDDTREISGIAPNATYPIMHQWSSTTGVLAYDSNDPGNLRNQICNAVLGYVNLGAGLDTIASTQQINSVIGTLYNGTVPIPIPININVIPAASTIIGLSIGGRSIQIDPGSGAPYAFTFHDGFYRKIPDPVIYGPYDFSDEEYGTWENSHFGAPDFANAPAGVNPSTGLPWTLADYAASIYYAGMRWFVSGAEPPGNFFTCITNRLFEANINILYRGASSNSCGAIAPPLGFGTIIINKVANIDDGTLFQFNAINLTPNAFQLLAGQSQQYDMVPEGSGYGIQELVPDGWQLIAVQVSNGSPPDNISVGNEEIVIITITDFKAANLSSGIYKIVKDKRQDTLWTSNFEGTRDVKIPNPRYKTGLFGE